MFGVCPPGGSLHEGILCQELTLDRGPDLCLQSGGMGRYSHGVSSLPLLCESSSQQSIKVLEGWVLAVGKLLMMMMMSKEETFFLEEEEDW